MSRFYGNITNNRSTVTKCGHKDGLTAHIRGWNLGIRVDSYINEQGQDSFRIYKTFGSNNPSNVDLIADISG